MSSHAFVVVSLVVCIFDNQALVASDLVALQTTNQLRGFPWEHGPHDQLDLAHLARFGRLPCPKADCWCVVHNGVVAWTLGVVLSGESLGETRCWLGSCCGSLLSRPGQERRNSLTCDGCDISIFGLSVDTSGLNLKWLARKLTLCFHCPWLVQI